MTPLEIDAACLALGCDVRRAALIGDRDLSLRACVGMRDLQDECFEVVVATRLPWRDAAGREDEPAGIRMRSPCRGCGGWAGIVRLTNSQHVVRCVGCAAYAYCAPSTEVATW